MNKITIQVTTITKIKQFETATVIYTPDEFWVCVPEQELPKPGEAFITLTLKTSEA